jgi:hypothetical protein
LWKRKVEKIRRNQQKERENKKMRINNEGSVQNT